jgi:hypothetical protein
MLQLRAKRLRAELLMRVLNNNDITHDRSRLTCHFLATDCFCHKSVGMVPYIAKYIRQDDDIDLRR